MKRTVRYELDTHDHDGEQYSVTTDMYTIKIRRVDREGRESMVNDIPMFVWDKVAELVADARRMEQHYSKRGVEDG